MAEAAHPLWDTHTHVLPSLDDGPGSIDDALKMVAGAASRGVTGIVATPHSLSVHDAGGPAVIDNRISQLKAALTGETAGMDIVPGMEIRLQIDTGQRLSDGACIPLNGTRHALIEFDYNQWANYSDRALFDVEIAGFVPVLAHVERIVPFQEHPHRVVAYVERGCLAQITAVSLLGGFGTAPKQTAEYLLKNGAVHVVASDMHRPDGNRGPWPSNVSQRLEQLVGEEATHLLVHVNPGRLVHGERPLSVTPRQPKRAFWSFR